MMKEELEKRLHNIAELLYEQGFDDGKEKGIEITQKKQIRFMYEQGLNDTWECIRKFRNLSEKERERIFDTIWLQDILCHFKPLEFVQKIKGYEARQKIENFANVTGYSTKEVGEAVDKIKKQLDQKQDAKKLYQLFICS